MWRQTVVEIRHSGALLVLIWIFVVPFECAGAVLKVERISADFVFAVLRDYLEAKAPVRKLPYVVDYAEVAAVKVSVFDLLCQFSACQRDTFRASIGCTKAVLC